MRLKRKKIDIEDEKNLLIGCIVSEKFLAGIAHAVKLSYLQSKFSKEIMGWILDYYKEYEDAPGEYIQSIFNLKREGLEEETAELIETFLGSMSEAYETMESFNVEYFLDRSIRYIKKRALLGHREKLGSLLDLDKIEEAEAEVANFKKTSRITSTWINPFEEDQIERTLLESEDYLMKLPGFLGDFLGPLKRKWLVSLMGPMKRGKTWWLDEFKFAALTNRLKVASISLEMDADETNLRSYKRMTATSEERGGKFVLPIFDCKQNQKGLCTLTQRVTDKKLVDDLGQLPKFSPKIDYDICTACMGKSRDFKPTVWYIIQERPPLTYAGAKKSIKGFEIMYGHDNLRTISYPINTVSISDVFRDLDILEYAEDFIPDVIIADYMDLFKPEDSRTIGREAINETWKTGKASAQNKKILWATATQSNRQSIDAKTVKQGHTGEDIRKLAHVDIMGVLNQTSWEKRRKIMRFGILVHRHKYFDDFSQIQVLQQLELGQPYLEGFNYYGEEEEEE